MAASSAPPARPQTLREAKAAYKKRSTRTTLTEADLRRISRQEERFKQMQKERDKEMKKRENKRKREEKEAKDRETKRRFGIVNQPKLEEGQIRVDAFLRPRRKEERRGDEQEKSDLGLVQGQEELAGEEEEFEEIGNSAEKPHPLRDMGQSRLNAVRPIKGPRKDGVVSPQAENLSAVEEYNTFKTEGSLNILDEPAAEEPQPAPERAATESFGEWADQLVSNSQLERELSTPITPEKPTMPPPSARTTSSGVQAPKAQQQTDPLEENFPVILSQDLEFSADDLADLEGGESQVDPVSAVLQLNAEDLVELAELEDADLLKDAEETALEKRAPASEASDDLLFAEISSQELRELVT